MGDDLEEPTKEGGNVNIAFEHDLPSVVDAKEVEAESPEPEPVKTGGNFNITFEHDLPSVVASKGDAESPAPIEDDEDGPEREAWGSPLEFLMSCISLSVGLGNIWRFPYIAYKNGGGAFLIPYLIILTFIGRPIYFLEVAIGQFSSFGQIKVWRLSPFFNGLGFGSSVGNICVVSFYAFLMSMTIFYLGASFVNPLPWAACDEDWINLGSGIVDTAETVNQPLEPMFMCNPNDTKRVYDLEGQRLNLSLSQLYFENEVLKMKYYIDDGIGYPEWRLTLCLFGAWLLIWGALIRGVAGSGKVAYFTALFPYAVLLIMFIRGVTLPGAGRGIEYFITPDWGKMLEANVWYEAVNQCFFSLSTSFGPLIMFGSYNKFNHNAYRDAWIVSGLDTFTSLFAGFTVFAVLGNLAQTMGVDIDQVARAGPGLTFVSFAQGLGTFTVVPQLFSVLFYLMMLTLGVGSAVALTQSLITIVCDQFPHWPRWRVTTGVCLLGFAAGIMYCTPGGMFIFSLVEHYGANFVIFFMALMEGLCIGWVYGVNNFIRDMKFMLNTSLGWYWKICWAGTLPVGLSVILVYSLVTEKRFVYGDLPYPDVAIAFGWLISAFGMSIIPLLAARSVYRTAGDSFMEKLKNSFKPSKHWGPKKPKIRREWEAFKAKQA